MPTRWIKTHVVDPILNALGQFNLCGKNASNLFVKCSWHFVTLNIHRSLFALSYRPASLDAPGQFAAECCCSWPSPNSCCRQPDEWWDPADWNQDTTRSRSTHNELMSLTFCTSFMWMNPLEIDPLLVEYWGVVLKSGVDEAGIHLKIWWTCRLKQISHWPVKQVC